MEMAIDFIAGCVGGAAGVALTHPLDTVKVRIQTQSIENIKYKGTFQALYKIAQQESITGLYKGISSPLYGVSFVNALVFGVYGSLRPYVIGPPGNNTPVAHAWAGAAAGAAQSIICSPMELVKIRMQLNESNSPKQSPWQILRAIYRHEGGLFRGVYSGYLFTLSREVPGFASYFATYEIFINGFYKYGLFLNNADQVGVPGMMISGGFAGAISWIACLPQDIFKTRYQSDKKQYTGLWDCMKKTCKMEGYQAFTRPLPSILIRAFPMNAITLSVANLIIRFGDSRMNNLETSQEDLCSLLGELEMTGGRTQETLYNCLHTPYYRLLKPNFYFQPFNPKSLECRQMYISAAIANSVSPIMTHNYTEEIVLDKESESQNSLSVCEGKIQEPLFLPTYESCFHQNNSNATNTNEIEQDTLQQNKQFLRQKSPNNQRPAKKRTLKEWILSQVDNCKRPEECFCSNCLTS